MATLALVISLAALLASSAAQNTMLEEADVHVWSSVSYIFHGEKTPLRGLGATKESLTPLGARQMFDQGSMFRARYIPNAQLSDDDKANMTQAPIENLSVDALDNTQMSMIASDDIYVSTSALAFLQGLYPPASHAYADAAGGTKAADLANLTLVDWPLQGYQYPAMEVLSVLDPNSVWIEGHVACTRYQESVLHFLDDPTVGKIYTDTLNTYHSMWDKYFAAAYPENLANFEYAYDLYEYASYQFDHDKVTHDKMLTANTSYSTDLAFLAELAGTQQRDLNGNLSVSGTVQGDMIRAISGRMLAGKILERMKINIASKGANNKLNLMFGSFEPFVAFFALSGLVNGNSEGDFQQLPNNGAAMMFELFSMGGNSSSYPQTHDLWVRFLYRNSSISGTPFISYPLFGDGNFPGRMQYADFSSAMQAIAVEGIAGWCNLCQSINLFCQALKSNSGGSLDPTLNGSQSTNTNGLNPVVAGAIGAAVTVFVAGALLSGAMIFGGVRYHRPDRKGRSGSLGGFKGAQKMASDTDVSYAKSGSRHERTSSWELRNGGKKAHEGVATGDTGAVVQPKDVAKSTVSTKNDDDDGFSILGHSPVMPREDV